MVFNMGGMIDRVLSNSYFSLFDLIKDTIFWVKDEHCRFIKINSYFAKYVNMQEKEVLGKTDFSLFPKEVALVYSDDDHYVIETGESIIEKLELLINRYGEAEWRKTTKLPLFGENGEVIGTVGISTPFDNAHEMIPQEYELFSRVIDYARTNLQEGIGVRELAEYMNISVSTLSRRFQQYLHMTPQKLLQQLKVSKACELLESSMLHISEIAYCCGYDSPAAFSRAFKEAKSLSPLRYRKENGRLC